MSSTSEKGLNQLIMEEGEVLKAYRCPAGVWTIGVGLTAASGVIKPKAGMVITKAQSRALLKKALANKYEPYIQDLKGPQHEFDGAISVVYNCGPAATKWKWYQALRAGKARESAEQLRHTATTANGKTLKGLVNRRAREARLIETGFYSSGPSVQATVNRVSWDGVEAKLRYLGYNQKDLNEALRKFQNDNGLTSDALPGPATRATLQRAYDGKKAVNNSIKAGGATGTGAGGVDVSQAPHIDYTSTLQTVVTWGLAACIVTAVALIVWRYRGPLFAWLPEGVKDFFQFKLGITLGRRVSS